MIEQAHIIDTVLTRTAVVRLTIPHNKMQEVMGPAIAELMTTLQKLKVKPLGPLFSRHFRIDPKVFDFEVGVPVEKLVMPSGRVTPSELPGVKVARTMYTGPYEGLDAAWAEFDSWITKEGHEAEDGLWERYVAGPETSDDSAQWRTELVRPLKK